MITNGSFDGTSDPELAVRKVTLKNKNGIEVELTNIGASLLAVRVPDRNGCVDDILLGFDTLEDYSLRNNPHFGGTIGRCANRIANGRFCLDGKSFQLAKNCNSNHLHGGLKGFDSKIWTYEQSGDSVHFTLKSEDGDEGYPGTLLVDVGYKLTDENELTITYKAWTLDKPTIVNLTNHAYINLAGQVPNVDVLDHVMEINSDHYLPHKDGIPIGEVRLVDDVFNFKEPKLIREHIALASENGGYDHNYCLVEGKTFCARVTHPPSGRQLEVFTSQPGLQFYTGNFLNCIGKNGMQYKKYSGFCLEPQNYPDAINQLCSPSCILRPGDVYEHFIMWRMKAV